MRRLIHGQLCLIGEELVSRLGWWADASRIGSAGDGEQLAIEAQKGKSAQLGPVVWAGAHRSEYEAEGSKSRRQRRGRGRRW